MSKRKVATKIRVQTDTRSKLGLLTKEEASKIWIVSKTFHFFYFLNICSFRTVHDIGFRMRNFFELIKVNIKLRFRHFEQN